MKNRPLFYGCLMIFLALLVCYYTGGAKFIKELRPSILEMQMCENDYIRLSGQVYDIEQKDSCQILYLKNNSITNQNKSFEESKIIIYDKEKLNIEIGNLLKVSGKLSFFEKERNPGCFDQKLYYQKQNIHASVWADNIEVTDSGIDELKNSLYQLRCQWQKQIYEKMGQKDGAILSAMLLAEKSGMDAETKELYQVNGVAHVLAISGLHLSVIGIGSYKIFRRLSGSFFIGGLSGIFFLMLYICMIGMSVSVFRALIMFLFRVGADMTGRHYDSLTAIAAAALFTILWQPLCLYDGGFWLSYGAILGIILILPIFEGLLCQGFWVSLSVNMMTLPILLFYFYEVPLYGILLNLAVVPLMTVVLMSGLTGSFCCLAFIPEGLFGEAGIGGALLWVCKLIFQIYENLCEFFLKFPASRIVAGKPEIWKIIIYFVCLMIAVFVLRSERKRRVHSCKNIIIAICIMVISVALLMMPLYFPRGISVTMLDVGQGDCIFVRGPTGKTYLIDGGSSDLNKVSQYQMEPFLKAQGVGKIDYVFVSHGDNDHISGIMGMIERMDVGVYIETIVFPDDEFWDGKIKALAKLAMSKGIRVVTILEGQKVVEDGMIFKCLAPISEGVINGNGYEDSNVASMILALRYKEFDMLFTGDVEGTGEKVLVEVLAEDYGDVRWDVLKVAHHGSKNSSSEMLLEEVSPLYSVISAGRNNSYGHPHEETVDRLLAVGSQVWSTQDYGAITIETDGKKMSVEGYLK